MSITSLWWIIGALLIVSEMLAPAALMLSLGVAALVVALIITLMPSLATVGMSLGLFSIIGGSTLFFWYAFIRHRLWQEKSSLRLNNKDRNLIGHSFIMESSLAPSIIISQKVEGTLWRIESQEIIDARTTVKIVGLEGTRLIVVKKT